MARYDKESKKPTDAGDEHKIGAGILGGAFIYFPETRPSDHELSIADIELMTAAKSLVEPSIVAASGLVPPYDASLYGRFFNRPPMEGLASRCYAENRGRDQLSHTYKVEYDPRAANRVTALDVSTRYDSLDERRTRVYVGEDGQASRIEVVTHSAGINRLTESFSVGPGSSFFDFPSITGRHGQGLSITFGLGYQPNVKLVLFNHGFSDDDFEIPTRTDEYTPDSYQGVLRGTSNQNGKVRILPDRTAQEYLDFLAQALATIPVGVIE